MLNAIRFFNFKISITFSIKLKELTFCHRAISTNSFIVWFKDGVIITIFPKVSNIIMKSIKGIFFIIVNSAN